MHKNLFLHLLLLIPDKIFNKILFRIKVGYWPNFDKPRSLNEKINYIKLRSNYSLREVVADRIKVREYVKKKSPECTLIKILWNGMIFSEEVYKKLPDEFVLKANHGSGMVLIVDKSQYTYNDIKKVINGWQHYDYGKLTRQRVYKNLKKLIIAEELIEPDKGSLTDYKFFCINGDIELVQVDLDRSENHVRNLYDKHFNRLDAKLLFEDGYDIKKPELYRKALTIAEKLSKDFDFIRVDLYITEDKIYFGELTNTPGNGFEPFVPEELDYKLGEKTTFLREFNK